MNFALKMNYLSKQLFILIVFISLIGNAQDTLNSKNTHKGELSFGVRTTGSLFSASGNHLGIGAGWQVRYRIANKTNSEWFADWITTDIGGLGQRFDAHIGESMIIYPGHRVGEINRFTPYILGGFCGDYTKLSSNLYFDDIQNSYIKKTNDRWSFATQLGLGTHYNITKRFDISINVQYVLHFGKDLDAEIKINSIGEKFMWVPDEPENALEGHTFLTISANFVVFDCSKK